MKNQFRTKTSTKNRACVQKPSGLFEDSMDSSKNHSRTDSFESVLPQRDGVSDEP